MVSEYQHLSLSCGAFCLLLLCITKSPVTVIDIERELLTTFCT